ncbi:hypothetical protein [Streptomyces europaeiscabiei]|uniref:hypothetical protein n=1 Tax=Streptomyces europaeiscabiei TaxID=146819 RepID=UPI0029AE9C13|nr:hypothetical protein [Streptomyces europaeiscabiei]MDX3866882.1 hypothetical protein [Streptomyces europaeiscabiei]MDX3873090.1 hypothetical protein [Streptomyces europaeiscabiei]
MTALALAAGKTTPEWSWPLDGASWDRDPQLSAEECAVLVQAGPRLLHSSRLTRVERGALPRLLGPLEQVRSCLWIPDKAGHHRWVDYQVIGMLLSRTAEAGSAWWSWDQSAWTRVIGPDAREWSRQWPAQASRACRPRLLAYAYLLGAPVDEALFLSFERLRLARTVFGPEIVDREVDTVYGLLRGWGYRLDTASNRSVRTLIVHAMLLNRSPLLTDMNAALLERLREAVRSTGRASGDLHSLQRALAALGRSSRPSHATRPCWVRCEPSGGRMCRRRGLRWPAGGSTPPHSVATSAWPTARTWPAWAGGWPPSTRRSPSPPNGRG